MRGRQKDCNSNAVTRQAATAPECMSFPRLHDYTIIMFAVHAYTLNINQKGPPSSSRKQIIPQPALSLAWSAAAADDDTDGARPQASVVRILFLARCDTRIALLYFPRIPSG